MANNWKTAMASRLTSVFFVGYAQWACETSVGEPASQRHHQ